MKRIATEEDWLREGLRQLGRDGELRIERIARALGCAKSGFYWYFGGRDEFLERLLRHWRETGTHAFYLEAERRPTPRAKLECLLTEVMQRNPEGDLLFHLRRLARKNALVRKALAKTEAERIGYLASLLRRLGNPRELAGGKAEVIYHYYLGWHERRPSRAPDAREVRAQLGRISKIVGFDK
jgi:AcrR family transcriptional regulator